MNPKIAPEVLAKILADHREWRRDPTKGSRADLTDADLTDADLTDADLTRADLTDADLTDADLTGANLTDANLTDANLTGANLARADLTDADLARADLTAIRDDVRKVLDAAPGEVPGLLAALKEGRVDGSQYEGECACLVGTIANVRKCTVDKLGIRPDSSRAAERFYMGIAKGDTPETSPVCAVAAKWVEEWLSEQPAAVEAAGK